MPTTVRCPKCDETFQADEEGGRIECPICEHWFEAPRRALKLADAPPGGRAALGAGAVAILRRGRLFQVLAHLLYLTTLALMMIAWVQSFGVGGLPWKAVKVVEFAAVALLLTLLVSWVLNVLAGACWAMVPTEGVSRPLGVAVLALSLLSLWRSSDLLLGMAGSPMGAGGLGAAGYFGPGLVRAFLLMTYFLEVARLIVLGGYLAAVARELGGAGDRTLALALAVVASGALVGPVMLALLGVVLDWKGELANALLVVLMLGGAAVAVICQLVTLLQMRRVWRRLERPAQA